MQPYLDNPTAFLDECMKSAFQTSTGNPREMLWESPPSTSQSDSGDGGSYAYSYSSTTNYTPETGTVSQTSKHYRDSSGTTKKVVERQIDDTVVTETSYIDAEGKEQISRTLDKGKGQMTVEEGQLENFDEDWMQRSDKVNTEPSTFVYVNLQPQTQLPLLGETQEGKKREFKGKRESHRESKGKENQSEVLHFGVRCDGCGMNPIKGLRFKSTKVEYVDVCESCEEKGDFEVSHGPFLKIKRSQHDQSLKGEVLHSGVFCDGCGMSPIRGTRYNSSKSRQFDLCSTCEEKGDWEESQGPFVKLKKPWK